MTINHACMDVDRLRWAVGLSPIPSLTDITPFVSRVIAKARRAVPASLRPIFSVKVESVSEGYKVSAGKVILFIELENKQERARAGLLSDVFSDIIQSLGKAGLDTSIVLCHGGKATAAISSSPNPNFVFVQRDDFDPACPNVASSLRGAQATPFDKLAQALGAMSSVPRAPLGHELSKNVSVKPSKKRDHVNRGAHLRSYGEGVSERSLAEREEVVMHKHVNRAPEDVERLRYLASDAFVAELTRCATQAAEAAISRHHTAGLSVHGERDGVIIENPPPTM